MLLIGQVLFNEATVQKQLGGGGWHRCCVPLHGNPDVGLGQMVSELLQTNNTMSIFCTTSS